MDEPSPDRRAARLVMLTSTGERRAQARELGIAAYLTKPVRRSRLLETVARRTPASRSSRSSRR